MCDSQAQWSISSRVTPTFWAVFQPTVIDMSNAGACGVSGWLGDIHGFISSVPITRFIELGDVEIDSAPPAMTTVSIPAMMLPAAVCTAAMPDAQWRLCTTPGTSMRPGLDRRVPGDVAAALERLAEHDVVDVGRRNARSASATRRPRTWRGRTR